MRREFKSETRLSCTSCNFFSLTLFRLIWAVYNSLFLSIVLGHFKIILYKMLLQFIWNVLFICRLEVSGTVGEFTASIQKMGLRTKLISWRMLNPCRNSTTLVRDMSYRARRAPHASPWLDIRLDCNFK